VGKLLHTAGRRPHERSLEARDPRDRPRPPDDLGSVARHCQGKDLGRVGIECSKVLEGPSLPPETMRSECAIPYAREPAERMVRNPEGSNDDGAVRRYRRGRACYAARPKAERLKAGGSLRACGEWNSEENHEAGECGRELAWTHGSSP